MRFLTKTLTLAALLVTTSQTASALELATTATDAQNGSTIACVLVNLGAKPATVTAEVRSFTDGASLTALDTCPTPPATLAAGAGCTANSTSTGDRAGYCRFTSKGKVRAALLVIDGFGNVTSTLPATK